MAANVGAKIHTKAIKRGKTKQGIHTLFRENPLFKWGRFLKGPVHVDLCTVVDLCAEIPGNYTVFII